MTRHGIWMRHAVWMRFAEAADAAERTAILGAFIALGDHLGHVSSFACGPDVDAAARAAGFGHAFVVVFETRAAHETYRALPEYAAAMARLVSATEGGADGVRVVSGPMP